MNPSETKLRECREAFEAQYASGDGFSDAISLARREDGEYEQALARMCFKWFCKGSMLSDTPPPEKDPYVISEMCMAYIDGVTRATHTNYAVGQNEENGMRNVLALLIDKGYSRTSRHTDKLLQMAAEGLREMYDTACTNANSTPSKKAFLQAKQTLLTLQQHLGKD